MFVADMDISWMQSPFLRHRCLLKTENDVRLLKTAGARKITIDVSRGADVSSPPAVDNEISETTTAQRAPPSAPQEPVTTVTTPAQPEKTSLSEEMGAASEARKRAESALNNSFAEWERGNIVFDAELQESLQDAAASLSRNDQALLRMLVEARREPSLVAHAFATYTLVTALAQHNKVAEAVLTDLGLAAILHDFGWLKLPRNLLLRSRPFTDKEQLLAAKHTALIDTLIASSQDIPARVKSWVHYHEHSPLEGDLTDLLADEDRYWLSALQTADKYDELCAGIVGNQGRTPSAALAYLYKNSLTGLFSSEWVQKLIFIVGVYPLGSAVLLSNNEKGIVAEIHRDKPLQPVVEVRYNRLGLPLGRVIVRELGKSGGDSDLRIVSALDLSDPKTDPAGILSS